MNVQQRETLDTLRHAVEQDQVNLRREILAKLVPDLSQSDSIRMVVKYARRFLSDLSRFHPEDENIGRASEALNNITSLEALNQQAQLIDQAMDKYWNWPGVSNFRNAFMGISKPQQYFEHSGEYSDTIVSMLSHILLATVTNNYFASDPEFSKTFFGPDVHQAISMLVRNHSDPKNIAIRTALWTEVVNDLDLALLASDSG